MNIQKHSSGFTKKFRYETLHVEPWGKDSIRVRATRNAAIRDDLPNALIEPPASENIVDVAEKSACLKNGKIEVRLNEYNQLWFYRVGQEKPFLKENVRKFFTLTSGRYRIRQTFEARDDEKIYGLGQHRTGFLNNKGCSLPLEQNNANVSIPFYVSNLGYGFLWNMPSIGQVELSRNQTSWSADSASQMDYVVFVGDNYTDIMERYAEITGKPPMLPPFAAGFWQCKLRYRTQDELLGVAREHKRRGLPMDVIVIDFFHSPHCGDWCFDSAEWPDPAAMVKELKDMGIETMVSIWPHVNTASKHYHEMIDRGYFVKPSHGVIPTNIMLDKPDGKDYYYCLYDASLKEARQYVWDKVREGYHQYGIRMFWLDACEPEVQNELNDREHHDLRYAAGDGSEVGTMYPSWHSQTLFDGLQSAGENQIITLNRSAWAGSQRYGAAVWSGDIHSTWESLQQQVRAGLNIAMSGIPWWTTDIGGFFDGYPDREDFRELIVRWFQYGVFCPLFRLHGFRKPGLVFDSGAANEVWSFGERAYEIIKELLFLRERMKPYIMEQMQLAHEKGTPPMRPLFFDFQNDPMTYEVEYQFMFGTDLLIAPVLESNTDKRKLYLPAGAEWTHYNDHSKQAGGQWITVDAPLEKVPFFIRNADTASPSLQPLLKKT